MCEAFEQLSVEGRYLTRHQQQQHDQQQQKDNNDAVDGAQPVLSARAARRNELHHATMAGRGGLLLNETSMTQNNKNSEIPGTSSPSTTTTTLTTVIDDDGKEKPAAVWDIEDCRSWLLDASRKIAQAWDAERKGNNSSALSKKIPSVPLGELEGRLVGHSIALCEQLETELQSRCVGLNGKSVVTTPRVADLSKLGIQWQHERGRSAPGATNERTAGQILLLKTAKKLGLILGDELAGIAFHRELRGIIARQEALKQKDLRDEATRQRFNQMKRKPWLQARLQEK